MSQRNHIDFIDLLNNLRLCQITTLQLELLLERSRISQTGIFKHAAAVSILPAVKQFGDYNNAANNKTYLRIFRYR